MLGQKRGKIVLIERTKRPTYKWKKNKNHGDIKGWFVQYRIYTEMGRNIRMKMCDMQTSE